MFFVDAVVTEEGYMILVNYTIFACTLNLTNVHK